MSNTQEKLRESLSALMDNETDDLEVRRLLRESDRNPELVQAWHRYQIAASTLRRELPPRMTDLSQRISAAIDQEPAPARNVSRFLQPIARMAVAASVAVVAVFGVQNFQNSGVEPVSVPGVAASSVSENSGPQFQLPAGYNMVPASARTVSSTSSHEELNQPRPVLLFKQPRLNQASKEEIQSYLNEAMYWHAENVAKSSVQGAMPYARLPLDNIESNVDSKDSE